LDTLLKQFQFTATQEHQTSDGQDIGSIGSSSSPTDNQTKPAVGTASSSSSGLESISGTTRVDSQTTNGQPTLSASSTTNADALFVFLAVKTGEESKLAQIQAQNLHDDIFFEKLRNEYSRLRGLLRGALSIWKYSHCDFVQVNILFAWSVLC
jgi:hypothetical protein